MRLSHDITPYLDWIDSQQPIMENLLIKLAEHNSGSDNLEGLSHVLQMLFEATLDLKGDRSSLKLPPTPVYSPNGETSTKENSPALLIRQRIKAPLRILLGGHMDTVFSASSPFQKCRRLADDKINGPGTADMKGGLVVLIYALKALERSPYAHKIGWDVLITPDEETGSVASRSLWKQFAWQNHVGLIFEPAMPGGDLVTERKGSSNYLIYVKGQKAHVGRDFQQGRNAVAALAEWVTAIHDLNTPESSINIGIFKGGDTINIVPDFAQSHINIRSFDPFALKKIEKKFFEIAASIEEKYGVAFQIHTISGRPPKLLDEATQHLVERLQECAEMLHIPLKTTKTGGVSDGNNLAAEGLPTLDNLGVIGGGLHTEEEWMWLPSLSQRAKLTASLLFSLAEEAPTSSFIAHKLIKNHPGSVHE